MNVKLYNDDCLNVLKEIGDNSIVWLYTSDIDLYELNGVLYLLADELSEAVSVINI